MENLTKKVTVEQVRLMKHACAFTHKNKYYRNYFVVSPDSDLIKEWEKLVEFGLAELRQQPNKLLPYMCYGVTEKGKEFLEKQ